MKKETKTTAAKKENNNINEVMEMAEVKVEVKGTQEQVKKERKVQRSFKEIILKRIDMKAKNLPDYSYDPIRESLAEALNELEILLVAHRHEQKSQKTTFRKLAKFTKEEIETYLKSIR
jgi:hypothetical protein